MNIKDTVRYGRGVLHKEFLAESNNLDLRGYSLKNMKLYMLYTHVRANKERQHIVSFNTTNILFIFIRMRKVKSFTTTLSQNFDCATLCYKK